MKTYKQLLERINMAKAKMGDVIKDFQDSDAPQFKGKSQEKRRQMAIAAKMAAEEVELEEGRMKEIAMDMETLGDKEFKAKHKKSKQDMQSALKSEELKGGQKNLDKNHNGKLDGQDFKILRSKKVEESSDLKPFIVVHAKHGKFETHAASTYEAAKNAAAHWKTKKGTAGMDVHRADITHSTQHVG